MKVFVCPCCENWVETEDAEVIAMSCECGSVMELDKRQDHYQEMEYIDPCMICWNKNKKCNDCIRS